MARVPLPLVTLAVLLTALIALPRAQSGAARHIEGRVVADDTGDPILNAKVGFTTTAQARSTLSGSEGRFALDLPAGVSRVTVTKAGYARRDVTLSPGRAVTEVRLARTAVISGFVVTSTGEPAPNVAVLAEVPAPGGQSSSTVATSITDDRGEFRLSGLGEGRVVVSAVAVGFRNAMVYFPGVESVAGAEVIEVKAGDEIDRINLALPASYDPPVMTDGGVVAISAQPLRPPTQGDPGVALRGRVVSATAGAVSGARVRLTQQATRDGATTLSDRDGRFSFAGLVPGPFLITASKTGFSGEAPPLGRMVTVTATGADTELTLIPWSSVSGRVLDELGEPVQGASMQLLRLQYRDGARRLVSAGYTRTTDDRGVFRIFGVSPGQYILSASAGDVSTSELPGYVRTYYPGVAEPSASAFLTLGAGQAQAGADVILVRQPTVRVSGIVRDAQGRPGLVGSLNLIPSQSVSALAAPVGARIGDGGTFEFPNVPPGQYVIQAYRGARNRSTEGEFATLRVSVGDRDVEGIVLQATAGSMLIGRVSFNGSSPDAAPPRSGIDIQAVPSDADLAPLNGRATADIRPDWTFVLSGISGPRRLEVTRTPPGWAVDQIRVRGIDVTDQPLAFGTAAQSTDDVEVVLTDRVTQVLGRVRDRDGRAAAGATAIVFAPTRDRWYAESRHMRAAVVGEDGRFRVEGLPPGHYYVAAVANVPAGGAGAWRDPSFLESLVAPSTSVTVDQGGRAEVALSVVEPR
jgi:hypothetical protein